MQRKITCIFTRQEMEVIKFLLTSLAQVQLNQPKRPQVEVFPSRNV
jgi:hypothetical protein